MVKIQRARKASGMIWFDNKHVIQSENQRIQWNRSPSFLSTFYSGLFEVTGLVTVMLQHVGDLAILFVTDSCYVMLQNPGSKFYPRVLTLC